jgi:predicted amidohydrolase
MGIVLLLVVAMVAAAPPSAARSTAVHYRAAVVEVLPHPPAIVRTREAAGAVLLKNAALIDAHAARAAAAGAQIVVFPELLACSYGGGSVATLPLYTESLPKPGAVLCQRLPESSTSGHQPSSDTPAAQAIACAAVRHNITIVTGISDNAPCSTSRKRSPFTQKPFPCDEATGLTQYNTQAAFGPDGALLGKYHKNHLARAYLYEDELWAEPAEVSVGTFDAPFGVRFGMIVCNDLNYGDPIRQLIEAGVQDVVFSTWWSSAMKFWWRPNAMQDAVARTHGLNFIAANAGHIASGSGIWSADRTAASVQHYNTTETPTGMDAWMGVADLTASSPTPLEPALPPPSLNASSVKGLHYFTAKEGGQVSLSVSGEGISCRLQAVVASGGGEYAFIAISGLDSEGGWYDGTCGIVACPRGSHLKPPSDPSSCANRWTRNEGGGLSPGASAIFSSVTLEASAPGTNVPLHSAVCAGGAVLTPRSQLSLTESAGNGTRVLQLRGPTCPLVTVYINARAQSAAQQPMCPGGKVPCSSTKPRRVSKHDDISSAASLRWAEPRHQHEDGGLWCPRIVRV